MNTDIRLYVDFWEHPKTIKLIRKLGLDGARSLQILWLWAARNRPDGVLSGLAQDDIEIVARWDGEPGAFFSTIAALHFLDTVENMLLLHDWKEHNPWQSEAEARADKSRFSRLRQVCPEEYERLKGEGVNAISKADYLRMVTARSSSNHPPAKSGDAMATPGDRPAVAKAAPTESQLAAGDSPAPVPSPSPSPSPALNANKKTPCQVFSENSEPYRLALFMRDTLKANIPTFKDPDLQKWAHDFDVALRNDERMADARLVAQVIKWACTDAFWRTNIHSPGKLREKFDQLTARMEAEAAKARTSFDGAAWKSPAQRRLEANRQAGRDAKRLLFGERPAQEVTINAAG